MKRMMSLPIALMLVLAFAAPAMAEPTKVTLAVWGSGAMSNFQAADAEFNGRQSDIVLEVEMANDWSTYIGAKIASNDLPDLYFMNPYSDVQAYAANGRLLDLSEEAFVGKLFENIKGSCVYDGKTYAYPPVHRIPGHLLQPGAVREGRHRSDSHHAG